MRPSQGQLKETLKILTYEFVNSVEKMCTLHHESLAFPKPQIYSRIITVLDTQKKSYLLDECVKMLQKSFDEGSKNKCFEKEFSFESSGNHITVSKMDESDVFCEKKSFLDEDSERRMKFQLISQHRSDVTTYNPDKQELLSFEQSVLSHDKRQVKIEQISAMINLNQSKQAPSIEEQEEENDEDSEYQGNESESSTHQKLQNVFIGDYVTKSMKKAKHPMRRIYRSYTDEQRYEAVVQAHKVGLYNASQTLKIPKKNIIRWMRRKEKNSKIRGRRPVNPNMEKNLTSWIQQNLDNGIYLTQTQIRNKAKQFSANNVFKASKGWLQKFFRRNKQLSETLGEMLVLKRSSLSARKEINVLIK